MNKPKTIPRPADAEKWISADIFTWQGKKWSVDIHLKVKEVKPDGKS